MACSTIDSQVELFRMPQPYFYIVNRTPDPESDRLPETGRHVGWNEVHFVGIVDFAHNAPSVLNLEIARLDDALLRVKFGSLDYNEIISVRYHLTTLVKQIKILTSTGIPDGLFELMEVVILNLSVASVSISSDVSKELDYVANRLDYILAQMRRLT